MSPVTCALLGIDQSMTIRITARDVVTEGIGENSQSFIIDEIPPTIEITAPTKINNAAITNTTIVIQDDIAINAADVEISAINTTDDFAISNIVCTQINTSRVDCTLQIDAQSGGGDIQVSVTDVAGNLASQTETGYVIDVTPPILELIGPSPLLVLQDAIFEDPGALWTDNYDGTGLVLNALSGEVDTSILGDYILQYRYTDTA